MNGQCSCGYRPGRMSSIDCRCVTHRELNERLRKIDPNEGYYQKEIDGLKDTKQDKLIAGQNITIEGSLISADLDSTNFYNKTETDELLAEKQDTLTAGNNIVIDETTISSDAHMLVALTPTGAPVGGVTDYTWTSEYTYAELVAGLDKVAFKTTEAGSENILVPTELYEALESGQSVIFGMIPSNNATVPKITSMELIVRPDNTAKTTGTESLLQPKLTAGENIVIDSDNVINAIDDSAEYIFPKFWANQYSQDCCIIKYDDKNIVIDSGAASNWSNIESMLEDNNIDKIDIFVLSHYDPDHVGNVENFINRGLINSGTSVYLPLVPDRFPSVKATETSIKSALSAENVSYDTPTEGQVITLSDTFSIKFGNLDKQYMEDNYSNYNYTSMVCLVKHKNVDSFYAGDAGVPTYTYLDSINFINNTISLYKQGHHGIDLPSNTKFIKEISPRYTVQCGGIKDFERGIYQDSETTQLIALGTLYYPSYINPDYIKFVSNGNDMNNLCGVISSYSNKMANIDIYVDSNAPSTNIQDGTQQNPFNEINQALGYINGLAPSHVVIHVADGTYGTETSEVDEISFINKHDIIIRGNNSDETAVVLDNISMFNSYVMLEWLTIHSSKNSEALRLTDSYVSLTHCTIDHNTKVSRGIVITNGSKAYINECTIKNCNNAVAMYDNSDAVFDKITLVNVDRMQEINKGTNQFLQVGFVNNEPNETICDCGLAYFSKIYITICEKTNEQHQNTIILSQTPWTSGPYNPNFHTTVSWGSNDHVYIDSIDVRLRSGSYIGSKIYLDLQKRVDITVSTGDVTVSDISGNYKVLSVYGSLNI